MARPTEAEVFKSIAAGTSATVRRGLQHFTLTEDHVKLLRAAWVSWDDIEFGAPCIDPKRPYGNTGAEIDIALILGWEVAEDEDGPHLTREQRDRALLLHLETEEALQVVLAAGSFTPGEYVADAYDRNWRLVRAGGPVGEGS